jgi:hypothetical protein
MRGSLVLLAVLAACSDASASHEFPTLRTQLSATVVSDSSGVLGVSLRASNPTDTTMQLALQTPVLHAQVKIGGQWRGALSAPGLGGVDALNLMPGAVDTIGPDLVGFSPSAGQHNYVNESFSLAPGTYSVRGCFYPYDVAEAVCGNSVTFTLTP